MRASSSSFDPFLQIVNGCLRGVVFLKVKHPAMHKRVSSIICEIFELSYASAQLFVAFSENSGVFPYDLHVIREICIFD
jgi:hypothetical protein